MSFGVLNVASSLEELEQKAHRSVPSIDDDKSPTVYLQQAREFQAEAKEFRLEGDDEREYMAYCKLSRLLRVLDNHLNIGRFQAEYNGIKMDLNLMTTRIEELKKRIKRLYNSSNEGDGSSETATEPAHASTTTASAQPIDLSAFWKSTSISSSNLSTANSSSSRHYDSDFGSIHSSSSNASFSSTSRDFFASSPYPNTATTNTTITTAATVTASARSSDPWGGTKTAATGYDAGSGKSIYERARLTKENDSFTLPELPQLPAAPQPSDNDYEYRESESRQQHDSSSKKGGLFSGWFGSGSSSGTGSTKKKPARRLPERPSAGDDGEAEDQDDDFLGHAMGNVMATAAQNEHMQEQIGSAVSRAAKSKEFRQSMGDAIASSTDNEIVSHIAQNEQFQGMLGEAVARTAGNKEFQRKVGQSLASAAQNKELREKAKKGALAMGRGLKNAAVKGWGLGVNIYEASKDQRARDEEYEDDDDN